MVFIFRVMPRRIERALSKKTKAETDSFQKERSGNYSCVTFNRKKRHQQTGRVLKKALTTNTLLHFILPCPSIRKNCVENR